VRAWLRLALPLWLLLQECTDPPAPHTACSTRRINEQIQSLRALLEASGLNTKKDKFSILKKCVGRARLFC